MLVLSSPSGAGKTTLTRRLLETDPRLTMSVSATTRAPRPGEVDGEDYYFKTADAFAQMIEQNAFLEHATVFDHRYGTLRAPVEEALLQGRDVVFDIDWQGTQQLSQSASDDLVKIFILPPTWEELERRLKQRAQDADDVVTRRMDEAASEMSHWAEYDYVIVNEDIAQSQNQIETILSAERMKRRRLPGLSDFVQDLVKSRS